MALKKADLKVILIGGTSNVGKSTLAAELSSELGWKTISTDSLAVHPGRPWKTDGKEVPANVTEYYATHTVEWLLEDVLAHYGSLWGRIAQIIRERIEVPGASPLILEGSALWPDNVATLAKYVERKILSCWLTATPDFLENRIMSASGYLDLGSTKQAAVRRFVERTQAYQAKMIERVRNQHLAYLDVQQHEQTQELAKAFLGKRLT